MRLSHLSPFKARDGFREHAEVTLAKSALDTQSAQTGTKRPFHSLALLLESFPVLWVTLVEDRVSGSFIAAQADGVARVDHLEVGRIWGDRLSRWLEDRQQNGQRAEIATIDGKRSRW